MKVADVARAVGRLHSLDTLRDRNFRYLLLTTGLERLAFRIREMGQAWLVLQLTDSKLWVGLVNGPPVVPVLMLSMWGGVLADRSDRRGLLICTRFILAGVAFILAFLITSGAVQLWHILLLAFAAAIFNAFGVTATQTLMFDIVGLNDSCPPMCCLGPPSTW
jgi:MFS family permease